MPLYTKYRCQKFDDILGNESLKNALSISLEKEDRPHTFLLTGEAGTGKTSTGRIIANELGCHKNDLYEYDIGSTGGIDSARSMKENCLYPPMYGKSKVYILDECQGASKNFWDASHKILEEPPNFVYFILCTTDPQKIPSAIKTRATKLKFELLSDDNMQTLLKRVIKAEGFKSFPKEAIKEIIKVSKGSPREALNILDLVIEVGDDDEVLNIIRSYTITEESVIDLCRVLLKTNNWNDISKILSVLQKEEPEKLRRIVLSYMSKVALNTSNPQRVFNIINEFKDNFYDSGFAGVELACYSAIL